ncbi:putative diacylglycerol pyrophosphate phosphatase 1 [Cyberlindnera fabianii]|uniref:Putative diacylglycerol pyrophosphate phosphatase 1 n=1 Tax=Cyberlindnera fabianii TaxID=36022 RepID=A0A1V2L896_CYBFA|nr:putative diacylglycerol pyrophosphate phosphatase 1 [Cyberlindnera fabianii]
MFSKAFKDSLFQIKNTQFSTLTALSYLGDWVIYIVLLIGAMLWRRGNPRYHEFSLDDNSISHTYYNDIAVMFNDVMLFILSLVAPVVFTFVVFGFDPLDSITRKVWNIFVGLLAFTGMHAYQSIVVTILKIQLGVPRPDMIQRCQPRDWSLPTLGTLNNVGICGLTNLQLIRDGFKSFPSGHAATASTSALFCFFLFATKYKVFDERPLTLKIIISILPFKIAMFLTASRFSDNRHFISDLIAGAIIGIFSAYLVYRIYFSSLTDELNSGQALPPRRLAAGDPKKLFWRFLRDPTYHYNEYASPIEDIDFASATSSPVDSEDPNRSHSNPAGKYSGSNLHTLRGMSSSGTYSRGASRAGTNRISA